ncbi:hypothetical protein ACFCZ3_20370 [Cellulosimicrobium cellulans]|uniref:hypothetical protein n=1 Tax=Cellulosimicrobium cellulans TaxID=1710 RepID=UPI0035E1ECE3
MTNQPPPRQRTARIAPTVDETEKRRMIEELSALTDNDFARALGENLTDENPVETAAFRSPELVQRTAIAARHLVAQTATTIKRRSDESNSAWQARAKRFRLLAEREQAVCTTIINGFRAQNGVLPNAPQPRSRALRRLARENPVRFLEILREEQEIDREKNRQKKEEQKRRRLEERRGRGR